MSVNSPKRFVINSSTPWLVSNKTDGRASKVQSSTRMERDNFEDVMQQDETQAPWSPY